MTPKRRKWIKHIYKEGARYHVLHWNSNGTHCSEPDCEVNKPEPKRRKKVCGELVKEVYLSDDYGLVFVVDSKHKFSLKTYQDASGAICSMAVERIKPIKEVK